MESEDWQKKFNGLNILRRIIKFNGEYITSKNISMYIKELVKGVDNLRSGISKLSLTCMQELSVKYGSLLDVELESIFCKIIKKSSDASAFIAEEVKRSLYVISQHSNERQILHYISQ